MYCSTCGADSIQGLQYCKRCGANLNPAASQASTGKPKGLVWIVAFGIAMMMGIPMGGIAVVFDRMRPLQENGFPLWFMMALAIASLLMMSVAMVLLSRLLAPVFKSYLQSSETIDAKQPKLSERSPEQINAPRNVVSSVTEDTTRVFDPVHGERDAD